MSTRGPTYGRAGVWLGFGHGLGLWCEMSTRGPTYGRAVVWRWLGCGLVRGWCGGPTYGRAA
eukprot:2882653-Rhodomonas_salina.1